MSGKNGGNRGGDEEQRRSSTGTADLALERSPVQTKGRGRIRDLPGMISRERKREREAGVARAAMALEMATFAGAGEEDVGDLCAELGEVLKSGRVEWGG